mgnify:FL=1
MEGERHQDNKFLDCINGEFLHQHVMNPTRNKNILDLVITSDENIIENISVGEPFHSSDHQIVRFEIILQDCNMKINSHISYSFFKANYNKVRSKIRDMNIMRKIESVDVNDSWMLFKKSMEEVIQEIIPIKKKFVRKQPWITKEVLKIRRAKIKAWKRFQTLRNGNEIAAASNNETGKEIILQQLRDKYVKKRNETKKALKEP